MIRANREELLLKLESVLPGLSPKEIVEQSSCFVFTKGDVLTYNGEIACRQKCDVGITGAVQASPLLNLLRKLAEEEVELESTDGELIVRGKRRSAGIAREKEILLPIESVEKPKSWKPCHDEFGDAVYMVAQCAGKDESAFALTCVHITPKWIEASDNDQIIRYRLPTGIETPTLVRGASIQHIVALDMTEFSETETWIHFKNSKGLILSCRRFVEEYADIGQFLKVSGQVTALPKGLGEACEKAEIFSSENIDDNQVTIELSPGKLRIKGEGVSGWYSETKKIKYSGEAMNFRIAPKLLMEIVKRHNECEIAPERLKVDGGKFTYVSCLGVVE